MTLRELTTLYFSPTGTSRRIAEAVADGIRHSNDIGYQCRDITFAAAPQREFPSDALPVAPRPGYAGPPAPLAPPSPPRQFGRRVEALFTLDEED